MTARVGYHCSHEQFSPGYLLELVGRAESAGFTAAMSSDHLAPWSVRQGESGHAWTWLGAALHATAVPFGIVTAPGYRYHPVITAQAIATVEAMFPNRFWVALGSGEALNEHVTGERWPPKPERNRRLAECAGIIRALLAGEAVDHDGLVCAREAVLWTVPPTPPPLFAAALSPATAAETAEWADGLITVNMPDEQLAEVIDAFRANGGEGKPVNLQIHVSWAATEAEARAHAHDQWRTNTLPGPIAEDLHLPEQFDRVADAIDPQALSDAVLIGADPAWFVERLAGYRALGADGLYLHQVGRNQEQFIDAFGERVLPQLGVCR